jgi:hypothetical protein
MTGSKRGRQAPVRAVVSDRWVAGHLQQNSPEFDRGSAAHSDGCLSERALPSRGRTRYGLEPAVGLLRALIVED